MSRPSYCCRSEPGKRPGWFVALEGRGSKRTQVLPAPGEPLYEDAGAAEKALTAAVARGDLES